MSLRRLPLAAALGGAVLGAAAAPPPPGHYDTELCVSVASANADCGPAQAQWRDRARLQVRVSDVVFRLQLRSSQADVTVMHGTMQIDEFSAPYEWAANNLQFADAAKQTRYEVQFGERQRAAK